MRAKLILNNGEEIEVELTKEQEKAIKNGNFPKKGDMYYAVGTFGKIDVLKSTNTSYDKSAISIGNYFKTEQEAKDKIRALKLIENVRRDRKRLNGDWKPDWSDDEQNKYVINYVKIYNKLGVYEADVTQEASSLGWYESQEVAHQIINKYKSELTWFFNEFLPERD